MELARNPVGHPLKAGVLSAEQFTVSKHGTPQGGILSPLLANIALSVLDERYERQVWPRRAVAPNSPREEVRRRAVNTRATARRRGEVVFFPIRYADDFLILVGAPPGPEQDEKAREAALREKAEVANLLREQMGLELSESKTLVTPVTNPIRFLGHHLRVRYEPLRGRIVCVAAVPKEKSHQLRERIKRIFDRSSIGKRLEERLKLVNLVLRGWSSFYRHAWKAKQVFGSIDFYTWHVILRWVRRKHNTTNRRALFSRYGWHRPGGRAFRWRDGSTVPFEMVRVKTGRFHMGWMRPPDFASTSMESPVHSERCTPGSEGGARKTS